MPDSVTREVELWKKRIKLAKRATKRMRQQWIRYLLLYTDGDWEASFGEETNLDIVPVNKIFSYTRSQLPRLLFRNPKIFTKPLGADDRDHADVAAAWCNALWQTLPLRKHGRLCVLDAILYGNAFKKAGFHSREVREFDDLVEASLEAEAEALEYANLDAEIEQSGRSLQDYDQAARPVELSRKAEQVTEYEESISPDLPWAVRVSPFFIQVDPSACSDTDARWMVHEVHLPIDDAKQMSSWSRTERDRLQVSSGGILSDLFPEGFSEGHDGQLANELFNLVEERGSLTLIDSPLARDEGPKGEDDESIQMTRVYEIWDKKTNTVTVIGDDSQRPLLRAPNPFKHIEGFPISHLVLNEVADSYWGMSDLRAVQPQVREITRLRSLALEHVKRCSVQKIGIQKGALDEQERTRLEEAGTGIFVEFESGQDVRTMVTPINLGQVSPDIYTLSAIVSRDFDEILGDSEQQRGVPGGPDTATESAITERNAGIRTADRQNAVSEFLASVTTQLWKISVQFVRSGKVFQMIGPKGSTWNSLKSEALRPEREMLIEVGSTIRQDDELRKRRIIETLNVLAPFVLNGVLRLDIQELARQYLEAQEFTDVPAILQVSQEELAQQVQFLQQFSAARGGGQDENVASNQAANAQAGAGGNIGGADLLGSLGALASQGANSRVNAGQGF